MIVKVTGAALGNRALIVVCAIAGGNRPCIGPTIALTFVVAQIACGQTTAVIAIPSRTILIILPIAIASAFARRSAVLILFMLCAEYTS